MNPVAIIGIVADLANNASRIGSTVETISRVWELINEITAKPLDAITQDDVDNLKAENDAIVAEILKPLPPE